MKKIYLLVLAIIVVALVWVAARRKPSIIEKPKGAQDYFEIGLASYREGVTAFLDAPFDEMSPEESEEYRKMVTSAADSAIKSYQEIIDKYPDSKWADDAQFCIAIAYFSRGDWDKTIAAFQKVITDYPEAELEPQTKEEEMLFVPKIDFDLRAFAQWRIGTIYYDKRDLSQAMIELKKVIDNYPQDKMVIAAAIHIERCSPEINDYKPAIKAYQKVLGIRTNTPEDIAFFEKKIKELQAKQASLKKQS